jgi:hypothetical protein
MNCKFFGVVLCAMLIVLCSSAHAQQAKKVPRIGWVTGSSLASNAHRIEAFRGGLRELGYIEGTNIAVEFHGANSNPDRLRAIIAELTQFSGSQEETSQVRTEKKSPNWPSRAASQRFMSRQHLSKPAGSCHMA